MEQTYGSNFFSCLREKLRAAGLFRLAAAAGAVAAAAAAAGTEAAAPVAAADVRAPD